MDFLKDYSWQNNKNKNLNQPYVDSVINGLSKSFKYSPSYFQVTKYPNNATLYDVWITEVKDDEEKDGVQKKKIIMYPGQGLEYGDYINWQNEVWLTVDKSISPYYDNGNLQKVNNYLRFEASDSTIQDMPCVMSFLNRDYLNINTTKELMTPRDVFVCKMQKNNYSEQIIESMRFLIGKRAYKVIATEDVLVKNIIEIKIQTDLVRSDDNFTTGIASQTIETTPTQPTNLSVSGLTSPKVNTNNTYTIINNTNYTFNWSLIDALTNNPLSSTIAQITSQSTTSCVVSIGVNGGKSFYVKAIANEDISVNAQLLCTTSAGF